MHFEKRGIGWDGELNNGEESNMAKRLLRSIMDLKYIKPRLLGRLTGTQDIASICDESCCIT